MSNVNYCALYPRAKISNHSNHKNWRIEKLPVKLKNCSTLSQKRRKETCNTKCLATNYVKRKKNANSDLNIIFFNDSPNFSKKL